MKVEALFLLFLGVFFGLVGLVYWFWSYEDGGSVMLLGTALLGFLPGLYYFFWHRRMGQVRAGGPRATPSRSPRVRATSTPSPARPSGPSSSAWAPS